MSLWNPGSDYEPTGVGEGTTYRLWNLSLLHQMWPWTAGSLTEKLSFSEKEAAHRLLGISVMGVGTLTGDPAVRVSSIRQAARV